MQWINHEKAVLEAWRDIIIPANIVGLEDAMPWVAIPPEVAMGFLDGSNGRWTIKLYMKAMQ